MKNDKHIDMSKIEWKDVENKNPINPKDRKAVVVDPELNGNHKISDLSGATYDGNFINGAQTGKGKLTYPSGTIYEGDFVEGRYHGWGKETTENGDVYEGPFKDGMPHGKGKLTYAGFKERLAEMNKHKAQIVHVNGIYYEHTTLFKEFTGDGIMNLPMGERYEGSFFNGEFHGNGKFYYRTGSTYIGGWENGMRKGYGEYVWSKYGPRAGDTFKGNWDEDMYNGEGTLYEKKADITTSCKWENFMPEGLNECEPDSKKYFSLPMDGERTIEHVNAFMAQKEKFMEYMNSDDI